MTEGRGDAELKQGMGEELYSGVREKIEEDPDYEPEKFSNAEKYYQPKRK